MAKEPVRVSQNAFAGHFDVSAALEKAKEFVAVLGEAVIIHAADADGEDILFAEAPSVAAQVAAKIKLRQFAGDAAAGGLRGGHLELDFACDHRGRRGFVPQEARHRTKVSSGANHKQRLDVVVDDPALPGSLYGVERDAFADARATAAQQIFVELVA